MPNKSAYRIAYVDTRAPRRRREEPAGTDPLGLDPHQLHHRSCYTRAAPPWMKREDTAHLDKIPVSRPAGSWTASATASSRTSCATAGPAGASARPGTAWCGACSAARRTCPHHTLKAHLLGGLAARLVRLHADWHVRDLLGEGRAAACCARRPGPCARAPSPSPARWRSSSRAWPCGGPSSPTACRWSAFTPGEPPPGLREEAGPAPRAEPVIICVGRLTPWKGHRTFAAGPPGRWWRERARGAAVVVGEGPSGRGV